MSVLIKGMEMPNRCPCKLVGVGYDMYCAFVSGIPSRVQEYYECCENGTRPDWCPLIEIPPHGRLIDADALRQSMYHEAFETDSPMQKWDSGCWIRYMMFERLEENSPTIIPTDKDGEP